MAEKISNHPSLPPNYVTIVDLRERWLKQKQKHNQPHPEEAKEEKKGVGQTVPPLQPPSQEKRTYTSLPPNYITIIDLRERWLKRNQKQQHEEKEGRGKSESLQQPQSQQPDLSAREDQLIRVEKADKGDHKSNLQEDQRENGAMVISKLKSVPASKPNPNPSSSPSPVTRRPRLHSFREKKPENQRRIPASQQKRPQPVLERKQTGGSVFAVSMGPCINTSAQKADDRSAYDVSMASKRGERNHKEKEVKVTAEEEKMREENNVDSKKCNKYGNNDVNMNPKLAEKRAAENETAIAAAKSVEALRNGVSAENLSSLTKGRDKQKWKGKGKGKRKGKGKGKVVVVTAAEERTEKRNKTSVKENQKRNENRKDEREENPKLELKKSAENETAIVAESVEDVRDGMGAERNSTLKNGRDKPIQNRKEEGVKESTEEEKIEKKGNKKYDMRHKKIRNKKANPNQEEKTTVAIETAIPARLVEESGTEDCAEIDALRESVVKTEQNFAAVTISSDQGESSSSGRRMFAAKNRPGWRRDGSYGNFQSRVMARKGKESRGLVWVQKGLSSSEAACGMNL